ncbi:MAG: TonB-dependent receptor [SAR86 cluster bacterium]|jgi:iron complex outermembrane receptor protein|nr:TonB-dependent receptor [Pseudomonadota bacterium]MDO7577288.1 TonB-dependent receptor [SAR86 cluster bacterium]MDO7702413.1 TonB-dependent receptor [SAR86 cluster bacterium]
MLNKFIWTASKLSIATLIAVGSMLSVGSFAQDNEYVEEVVSIGTRGKPRSVSSSPVPVDVLSAEDISKTGTDDLLMQLQGSIPSLNVHLQPISDAASMIRPANLRGLSADSTLITTNGKRRHHASVIAFQGGGVNDGSQGADISVIPAIALKRVEVLRDGASAQYGSDAIAGVINFVLDDISEGGSLSYKMGEYTEGDGATTTIAGKYGLPLGQDGFVTTSFQIRQADDTSRSLQRPDAAALIAAGNTAVANPAQVWGAPKIDDDVTFFMNAGVTNSDGSESYMFGNYSERDVDGGFYYRNPDGRSGVFTIGDYRAVGNVDGTCAYGTGASGQVDPSNYATRDAIMADPSCFLMNEIAPGGYTPRFVGTITDTSFTTGRRGEITDGFLSGYSFDVSGSVGRNEADFGLNNTVNPSMGPDTPRNFTTGSYIELEKTFNFDLQKQFDSVSVAYGVEWREETFEVISGEEASWKAGKYALQGFNVGSHGFAGFSPDSQGSFTRRSYGLYTDIENQVSDELLLGGAFRYEDYSSFGDTNDFKLKAMYQVNDNVSLRASTSTGFRAPTQGQVNVVNTQTTLVDGQLTQAQTLPGFKLGAGQLKPEEATNTSFGIVYNEGALSLTADFFTIELEDRVALTSNAAPTAAQVTAMGVAGIPNPELIGQVNYFTNDFDTETTGYDLVAVYSTVLMGADSNISAAWNHTETEVTNSGAVTGASKVKRLEEGLPEDRMTLTLAQTWSDKVSTFVRANMYGEYYAVHADWFGTTSDAEWTVDASVNYQLTDNFNVSAGVQNLFDTEALKIDGSAGAKGEGVPGNVLGGIYYETSPYGIEGAFWYVSAGYNF